MNLLVSLLFAVLVVGIVIGHAVYSANCDWEKWHGDDSDDDFESWPV